MQNTSILSITHEMSMAVGTQSEHRDETDAQSLSEVMEPTLRHQVPRQDSNLEKDSNLRRIQRTLLIYEDD